VNFRVRFNVIIGSALMLEKEEYFDDYFGMLRKFLPLFVLGVLGIILMIAFVVQAPFKENEVTGSSASLGELVVVGEKKEVSFQKSMRKKLNELRLPELNLHNATIAETVEFLRLRLIELSEEEEPSKRGLGFMVTGDWNVDEVRDDKSLDAGDGFGDGADVNSQLISLSAKDIGIADALDLICAEAGLQWMADEEAVKILMTPLDPVRKKLAEMRIPRFELGDENLEEAIEKLRKSPYIDDESGEVVDWAMSYVIRFPINFSDEPESVGGGVTLHQESLTR